MARVGKYQALGRSLGQYKKTLYDVGAKEYQKQARKAEGEFQRGMYSAVGSTIANLAGIAHERARLKELEPLDPGERPETPIESEEVEMLGDQTTEDFDLQEFKPFEQPSPAPEQYGSLNYNTTGAQGAYGDLLAKASHIPNPNEQVQVEKISGEPNVMPSRESQLTEDSAYNISGVLKQTESGGLPQSAFDAMQDDPPLTYEEARTKSRQARGLDGQGKVRGADDEKVRAERLGITVEELNKKEADAQPAGQQVVVPTGSNRASYAKQIVPTVGTEDSQWKLEDLQAMYGDNPRSWNVDQEYTSKAREEFNMLKQTEAQTKQWDAEDKTIFGEMKKEDNFSAMGTNGDWGHGTNGGYDNPKDIQANMSQLEKNIAMSENAPFFESLGKKGSEAFDDVYARGETDLSKAEKRPASGFGTLAKKGEKQIDFKTAVSRMKENINEARSSLKKEFKGFEQFTPSQQDSLIEMVYQMGFSKIKTAFPSMIKAIHDGRWDDAQKEALYKDREDLNRGKSAWALQTPKRAIRVAEGFTG